MEGLELVCFEIISNVGAARSCFINAISEASSYHFEEAENLIKEGNDHFIKGHHAHANLIKLEANGELDNISLILIHAEDQLMSAESFKILSNEFISVYKEMHKLKQSQ